MVCSILRYPHAFGHIVLKKKNIFHCGLRLLDAMADFMFHFPFLCPIINKSFAHTHVEARSNPSRMVTHLGAGGVYGAVLMLHD